MKGVTPTAYFFGTFNPIHLGHLMMAETALSQFGFERICFVPSFDPPHRNSENGLLPFADRLKMVRLAIQGHPRFEVSAIEQTLPKPSYTVNTLKALCPTSFNPAEDDIPLEIAMIIGGDAIAYLYTWHEPEALMTHCWFLQAPRLNLGDQWENPVTHILLNGEEQLLHTTTLHMPLVGISASAIRSRIQHKQSIRYWVPEPVRQYIDANGLYKREESTLPLGGTSHAKS